MGQDIFARTVLACAPPWAGLFLFPASVRSGDLQYDNLQLLGYLLHSDLFHHEHLHLHDHFPRGASLLCLQS